MVYVKNDFVSMDWEAEKFFESKEKGFIAAVQTYSDSDGKDVHVCFMDNKAFILADSDTGDSVELADVRDAVKNCFEENENMEDLYPDNYSELGVGIVNNDDIIKAWNLSSYDKEDINKRLEDLSGYWETYEVDMC